MNFMTVCTSMMWEWIRIWGERKYNDPYITAPPYYLRTRRSIRLVCFPVLFELLSSLSSCTHLSYINDMSRSVFSIPTAPLVCFRFVYTFYRFHRLSSVGEPPQKYEASSPHGLKASSRVRNASAVDHPGLTRSLGHIPRLG
jgi:hypothetical protein